MFWHNLFGDNSVLEVEAIIKIFQISIEKKKIFSMKLSFLERENMLLYSFG
jgi:hypothetical protein